ncbi:hypothetical protein [Methylobacterium sp. Leaf113]|uniref:hypothetical protein n=1 Tax=Methylobacterium sp. Leaf113 TaxID=1736259 RepID=UPI0012E8C700|nr:hypothetical protein [Methylobacterium sp. Leaf113]
MASPVDTFVRPQEPSRDTNLQDLARSLSGLGGQLAGMVGKRDAQAEEDDKIRGEAAFWQSNGTGAAEAVAKGIIPAQASPAYMRAYKRLEGEVAGGQLEQKFSAAYDTWEGKSSTDPKAYDAFVGGFIKDNITTDDPDVLRGLLPKVQLISHNYLQRHIGDASKATQSGFTTALSARGEQAIDDANTAGLASKQGTDYAGVFGKLEAIRAEGLKVGANREQVDQKLIDTVTTAAITKRDPKLLDFLDRKVPGQDYTWTNTPYGRDQRQKTIDTLESMGRKSIADDEKRNREEKAATKDDVTRRTIQAITESPNDPIPEDLLAAGEKVDPDFRVNAIRWRDTVGKGTQTSDPEDMLAITTDIINGGGLQRVQRGIRERVFKNPEDLTRAYKLAEGMKAEGPKLDEMLRVGTAKTIIDTLKKQTATEKDASKILFDDGSMSREGLQSTSDYKQALMEWLMENPGATSFAREKAAQEIGAKFLDRLSQPEGPMSTTYYDRQGLGSPNTFGASAPPKAGPTAPLSGLGGQTPARRPGPVFADPSIQMPSGLPGVEEDTPPPKPAEPAPRNMTSSPEGAATWYRSLPPETKAAMKKMAEKQGLTERHMSQILHQRALDAGVIISNTDPRPAQPPATPGKQSSMKAPDGTPIETASAQEGDRIARAFQEAIDPPPTPDAVRLIGEAFERAIAGKAKPQGGYASASLKDDPKAARILDFVAGPESGGNYNAYFGNGRSTKDLSAMTLDRKRCFQATALRAGMAG